MPPSASRPRLPSWPASSWVRLPWLPASARPLLLRRSLLRRGLLVADRGDHQDRVLLAMAFLAAVIVPPALLEDDDLLALRLRDDLGRNRKVDRKSTRLNSSH